ncbi:hypothetical protein ACTXT7_010636 [Hymenolepis weldensis]
MTTMPFTVKSLLQDSVVTTLSPAATNSCLPSKIDPEPVIQNTMDISPHHSTQNMQFIDCLYAYLLFIQLVPNQLSTFTNPVSVRQSLPRRARTVFSDTQLSELEQRFKNQKYLSNTDRLEIASALGLSETQAYLNFLTIDYLLSSTAVCFVV